MIEIWKDIEGYENSYQISNLGRVKSLGNKSNHKKEIILKQCIIMGYKCVGLTKNSKMTIKKVHRLVANAFISNTYNKQQVNHKDGNKFNNCVNNLEWCTAKENSIHAVKNGLRKALKGEDNPRSKKVVMLDKNNNFIKTYNSLREIERETNLPHSNIVSSIKRNGICGGYKWKIID